MKPDRIVIYPGFMSAEEPHYFKKTLGALLVYRDRAYQPRAGDFIIGWGNSHVPNWAWAARDKHCPVLNHWTMIATAVNKRNALYAFDESGVSIPRFTTRMPQALAWRNAGHTVMARLELKGMRGAGIYVSYGSRSLPEAPLYTRFIPDCREFRIHIFRGRMINAQEKLKKNGVKHDPYVRSEENGYVFARKNIQVPYGVIPEARKAISALGLDFGAADVLYSENKNQAYILEVNTAPGITDGGYGGEAYTQAFKEAIAAI